ncbi:MAG: AMP-binding protein [Pseudomonadota bacterium]
MTGRISGADLALPRAPLANPFAGMDLPMLLARQASVHGDRPFLIWAPFDGPTETWSYARFHRDVAAVAAGMAGRGIRPGDPVLLHMDNCPEMAIAWHACARIGAIAVTTNTRSSGPELGYFASHSGAVAAITQPRYAEIVARHAPQLRWLACTARDSIVPEAAVPEPNAVDGFARLYGDPDDAPVLPPDPMRRLSIQYTSGTTSRPKAVLWSHANALWGGLTGAGNERLTPQDVHLVFLPLFHTNALSYSMLATLWAGARFVLQPRFSISRFWDVALEQNCTWCSMVGFMARALVERPLPERHCFRVLSPAVAYPPLEQLLGVRTMGLWGMTETITQSIVTDLSAPSTMMSIGRPHPAYDMAVLGEDGRPVQSGETGSLLVRGVRGITLFREYLHEAEATRSAFDERGYFITGDRVTLLENGEMRFADREKDMLKVGGENVAASEVEAVIAAIPGVREVAVVGRPHAMLDEVPVAFVIATDEARAEPDLLAERIGAVCRNDLADFKVPREIRLVESLPRAALEKVAKSRLRAALIAERG